MMDVPADPNRDTRAVLLTEFTEQLRERGYLGVSLERVAASAGIRKPSLFHHFPAGKPQMYREVALKYIERQAKALDSALRTPGGLEPRLEAIVAVVSTLEVHHSAMDQHLFDATRYVSDDVRREVSQAYVASLIEPVVELMADGARQGDLPEDADPGFLAWAFLSMAAVAEPMPPDVAMPVQDRATPPPDEEPIERRVVRLFLDGARRH